VEDCSFTGYGGMLQSLALMQWINSLSHADNTAQQNMLANENVAMDQLVEATKLRCLALF
jgi:hypothetical protein